MATITQQDIGAIEQQVKAAYPPFAHLRQELQQVIVGQHELLEGLVIGLLCNGHVLIEGVPGLAKTTAVATLAAAIRTTFHRIQFTPDLLPSDLVGTMVYSPATQQFSVKKGPIFANIVLADEINRAPAKVQSALLEAMQERQVTLGDRTLPLPRPFLVLATQNPIEQEGTYTLPEAQVDRFMLKLRIGYPDRAQEREIMRRMSRGTPPSVQPVLTPEDILDLRSVADRVYVDARVEDYIVDLVLATRSPASVKLDRLAPLIRYGASPRATITLHQASRVQAMLSGRGYVTPQDVKTVAPDVLRHRIHLSWEAEARDVTADDVVRDVLAAVDVP